MRRPRLRALTEDGQSYDDPSEDVLYLLVQDIAAGERSWVIVEQVAHPSGQTYTQLLRLVDGSYQVERRPGQGERIRHGAYSQHSAGSMALSSGVTGAHLS